MAHQRPKIRTAGDFSRSQVGCHECREIHRLDAIKEPSIVQQPNGVSRDESAKGMPHEGDVSDIDAVFFAQQYGEFLNLCVGFCFATDGIRCN